MSQEQLVFTSVILYFAVGVLALLFFFSLNLDNYSDGASMFLLCALWPITVPVLFIWKAIVTAREIWRRGL